MRKSLEMKMISFHFSKLSPFIYLFHTRSDICESDGGSHKITLTVHLNRKSVRPSLVIKDWSVQVYALWTTPPTLTKFIGRGGVEKSLHWENTKV